MPYSMYPTDELLERYQHEKDAILNLLIRHPELSQESIHKLGEPLRLMQEELKKRGKLFNERGISE